MTRQRYQFTVDQLVLLCAVALFPGERAAEIGRQARSRGCGYETKGLYNALITLEGRGLVRSKQGRKQDGTKGSALSLYYITPDGLEFAGRVGVALSVCLEESLPRIKGSADWLKVVANG